MSSALLVLLPRARGTTCALLWHAQQRPSQLVVHSDFQVLPSAAPLPSSLGNAPWVHTDSSVSFPSVCLLLRSHLFSTISASSPPPPFLPRALQPGMQSRFRLRHRRKGSGANVGQASCRSAEARAAICRLTVLAGHSPVCPSQGPCCGPVLLFAAPMEPLKLPLMFQRSN